MADALEAEIKAAVLVSLSRIVGVMVWNNPTGVCRALSSDHVITYGLKGSADIIGCAWGRAIAIETKRQKRYQTGQQKRFQAAWEKAGGFYLVARDAEGAVSEVMRLRS